MWQSHVEIEDYSVAYFDRIAAFKVPYHCYTCFVDSLANHAASKRV